MLEYLEYTDLPAEYATLREQVRAFLHEHVGHRPVDERVRSWMGFDAQFSKALAARGWVGLTLPRSYGGAQMDALARFVVVEELLCAGAPVAAHWIADRQSGPLLLKYGTQEQKAFYLPSICKAEALFCIGMSEPNSGSDLASVSSRAHWTGDGWRLSGQKSWTTYAQHADYMIALVRTSGTREDRHKGLSQVVVDLNQPNVRVRPIRDMAGSEHFCEVFFDDVVLPANALIGTEGQGWEQVTAELAFERSGPERIYSSAVLLDSWLTLQRQRGNTRHQALVGRLIAQLSTLRALSIAVTAKLVEGKSPVIEAALVKDLGTEFEQALPLLIGDALASDGQALPSELRRALFYLLHMAPTFSLRGGTREILRGVIARGLDLR